jgi:hypothetical protein
VNGLIECVMFSEFVAQQFSSIISGLSPGLSATVHDFSFMPARLFVDGPIRYGDIREVYRWDC